MRVLYHHRTASRDGQAVHIDEMIHALRRLGHDVCVVAPVPADDQPGRMGQEIGWVQRLRTLLPAWIYELLELCYSIVAYRRLSRAAQEFQPDFIYERYNLYMLAGVLLARRRRIPFLVEVNAPLAEERSKFGGLSLPRLAHWTQRTVWQGADRVFVVTAVLGRVVESAGVPKERIVVTPNGINPEHFSRAPSREEAKASLGYSASLVLGFTGFVRDWHGVDRVIRWLANGDAPEMAQLLVVGDGPARADLEALASGLGLGGRVRFLGLVHRDEVPALVASFDIALQPAVVPYASPLKLFEYLALGKAVVAPKMPNIEEILTHDQNAVLFDPTDPQGLERSLTLLARDEKLRARLAAAGMETITSRNLTWEGNARVVATVAAGFGAQGRAPSGPSA